MILPTTSLTTESKPIILPQQTWSNQQIVGLAQNDYHVRSSRSLAIRTRWKSLAIDSNYVWGTIELKNTAGSIIIHSAAAKKAASITPNPTASNISIQAAKDKKATEVKTASTKPKEIIQTAIRLSDFQSSCTCVSHQSPCQHALALLLLIDEVNYSGKNVFTEAAQPEWLLDAFKGVVEKRFKYSPSSTGDSQDSAKREAMTQGLMELELWLSDLLRSGLNTFKHKPHDYTTPMSHRLIDSELNDLARDVTRLSLIPKQHKDWPEVLLTEIGRMYALIQAFKKIDDLPKAVQGDVYMALGCPQIDTSSQASVTDTWYILGKSTEQQSRIKEQRIWLYGLKSKKIAFIARRHKANEGLEQHLLTASSIEAELLFYTSQYPLKAEVNTEAPVNVSGLNAVPELAFSNIAKNYEDFRKAKAQNPWLKNFPMLLGNVRPSREQNKIAKSNTKIDIWSLNDDAGYQLPLIRNFKYGWHLMALGMSDQLNFFAEWNGYELKPVSLWQNDSMHDVTAFRSLS